ncbi:hypothetical protein Tco_1060619 [Tanacetum coccineum]
MVKEHSESDKRMSHHTTGYRIDNLDIHYWYYEITSGGVVDLTGDEDPTDEDRDIGMGDSTGVSMYLGGKISSRGKKSQESNIGKVITLEMETQQLVEQ